VLVVILLPALYVTISYLQGSNFNSNRELRYSGTQQSPVEADRILSIIASNLNAKDLNQLRSVLKGFAHLPPTAQDPLRDYLSGLANVTDNLVAIETGLRNARTLLAAGNVNEANARIKELELLIEKTRSTLETTYTLLNRVGAYYNINVSTQTQKLDDLQQTLTTYSTQVDDLTAMLPRQVGLNQTRLTLNALSGLVFVGEPLTVYGTLRNQNETALGGRNITITWAGMSRATLTDAAGNFTATLVFPPGYPAGLGRVLAAYVPVGEDAATYIGSENSVTVTVAYHLSVITATATPSKIKPLEVMEVNGTLAAANRTGLPGRLVELELDGRALANATTSPTGSFHFKFQIPVMIGNGTHAIRVAFNATRDVYSSSSLTIHFLVELLQSKLLFTVEPSTFLSGMSITLTGNITHSDGTPVNNGTVTIVLENWTYNTTVGNDGNFSAVISTPIQLGFGNHSIRVLYNSTDPIVAGSGSAAPIYVYNSPTLVLIAATITAGGATGTIYLTRMRRKAAAKQKYAQPVVVEKPVVQDEYSPATLSAAIEAEPDGASKVRRSFRLAQSIINHKLGIAGNTSETPWEYFRRIIKIRPQIAQQLRRLTELFELAAQRVRRSQLRSQPS